jgi:hypothetical protein
MREDQAFRDARIKLSYYTGGMAGIALHMRDIAASSGAPEEKLDQAMKEFYDLVGAIDDVAGVIWPHEENSVA